MVRPISLEEFKENEIKHLDSYTGESSLVMLYYGTLEAFRYYVERGYPIHERIYFQAEVFGHYDKIRILMEMRIPIVVAVEKTRYKPLKKYRAKQNWDRLRKRILSSTCKK